MAGVNKSFFCRELFEKCNIFPHVCEYPVSLLSFIIGNISNKLKNTRALPRQIIRETEEETKRFNSTDTRITEVTLLPGQHQVRNANY